jgi:hypothetical protein
MHRRRNYKERSNLNNRSHIQVDNTSTNISFQNLPFMYVYEQIGSVPWTLKSRWIWHPRPSRRWCSALPKVWDNMNCLLIISFDTHLAQWLRRAAVCGGTNFVRQTRAINIHELRTRSTDNFEDDRSCALFFKPRVAEKVQQLQRNCITLAHSLQEWKRIEQRIHMWKREGEWGEWRIRAVT